MVSDKHPRILIIDDEPSIVKLLSRLLASMQLEVDTALSGGEGIQKMSANAYSLVLTDIKMPGITGIDVLGYVRDQPGKPTPVIAMSGTPWLLEESAFDAVLAKPFSRHDLIAVMKSFI